RNEATIRELTSEAIRTLEEFQGAIRDVRSIVSDPQIRSNLESSIEKVPQFIDEATVTLRSAGETFKSFEKVGTQFEDVGKQFEQVGVTAEEAINNVQGNVDSAFTRFDNTLQSLEGTFENIEKFSDPLGERGGELVGQVLDSLESLDLAAREIQGVGKMINQSDGSIRRLFEDDELYFDVLRTIENVEMATAKLRPIMDDVRIFSNKIARDPRQLGIRGVIQNRPSGLGLK
ncbi:MAG: mammalian cell entry protein, partial [Planctomycetota bacterium]